MFFITYLKQDRFSIYALQISPNDFRFNMNCSSLISRAYDDKETFGDGVLRIRIVQLQYNSITIIVMSDPYNGNSAKYSQ